MADKIDKKWVSATLVNDENSSDSEMKEYFIKEGKMSEKRADCYVKQRDRALLDPINFKLRKC